MVDNEVNITVHLSRWRDGDCEALSSLVPVVSQELKRIARRHLRRENRFISLHTTELINEAYIRLIDTSAVDWQNRSHFFAVAAKVMRNLLTDRARRRNAKGVPAFAGISIAALQLAVPAKTLDLVLLDEALKSLELVDPRKSEIVELKFFGGMTAAEIAVVLGVSEVTVKREWLKSKAFLYNELKFNG